MIVLTIRTDNPEAEIGLYEDSKQLSYKTWHAHRQLAETLHAAIREQLQAQKLDLAEVGGIVCYQGPGSFTGLRIGLSVGNALGYALEVPIVGTAGDDWQQKGISRLASGENQKTVMPEYGADVHITLPKH